MNQGLLSILMPVKNTAPFLVDCVESILHQSEKNWELIAVDDHSTDQSLDILSKYCIKDKRIRTYINDGKGIIDALKTAYSYSEGEFIHRMDSDDLMPDYKLEKLKDKLIQSGKGNVITGKVKYFSDKKVSQGYLEYESWLNELCDKQNHWQNIYRECVIASPVWLIYRSDLDKCGAFNSNIYPEDYDLIFRMYRDDLNVIPVKEQIHLWREHPERTSRRDENYNQESFFRIKLRYFMELDRNPDKELIVLGAGVKGEIIHDLMVGKSIRHQWLGKTKKEKSFEYIKSVISDNSQQVIILFSAKKSQEQISKYLKDLNMKENSDFFFFR